MIHFAVYSSTLVAKSASEIALKETLLKAPSISRKTLRTYPFSAAYSPFNFVGEFVQGCFSRATLFEAELPFVQVSGDVEVVLHVPQQNFLLEFE